MIVPTVSRDRGVVYALAVVATIAAAVLSRLLATRFDARVYDVAFLAAVTLSGWYGGLWPALLSTALGAAAAAYWFAAPSGTWLITTPDAIDLGLLALVGALIAVASQRLHAARREVEERQRRDSEERRAADRAQALLAAVVESSQDAIFTKSLDGRILSWNAGAEQMFGYSAEEAVGGPMSRLVPAHRRDEETDVLERVGRGERVLPFETERIARGGAVLDVSVTLSPVRDETGRIVGASSIARDIRERKALEASLREADRRKDDFLAVLAHELRNPLAPIRNSVAVVRLSGSTSPVASRAAEVIDRQTRHMARLLDDLLDVSRITRNRLDLRRERVALSDVLDAALESTRGTFEALEQTVAPSLPPSPVYLDGDPVRLAQVFANLLGNAAKYSSRRGRVAVTATVQGEDVAVDVADEGIGIAPEMLPHVFEMFAQAAPAVDRASGGLGIGLALVKGMVELHGGRVEAYSDGLGCGSRFRVVLPVAPSPIASDAVSPDAATGPTGRILVVDDNRDSADSLALLLTVQGHTVRAVYDGESALAEIERFEPHVVLLDLGMPDLDGYATARRLRSLYAERTVFLVAVTGWGQERDRRQTSEAGFDAHMVKPVDPDELNALVSAVVG